MSRALLLHGPCLTRAAARHEKSRERPSLAAFPGSISAVVRRRRNATRNRIAPRALGDDDEGDEYEFSAGGPGIEEAADAFAPLAKWLGTPTDVLSFGPRAALGALLSLPRAQERLSAAAEAAAELIQDPRPPLSKCIDAARAAAEEITSLVESGAGAEAKAISAALDALPPELTDSMPPEFLAAVERAAGGGAGGDAAPGSGRGAEDAPSPSSTSRADTPSAADRAAEEAATLAAAAARVSEAADALAAALRAAGEVGGGGGNVGMARLNAREARAALARALEQASPSSSTSEASKLLDELDEALLAVAG